MAEAVHASAFLFSQSALPYLLKAAEKRCFYTFTWIYNPLFGFTGHAQSKMVSDVYSHILDEGRKHNAQLFEKAFYSEKAEDDTSPAGGSLDVSALQKLLANPEAAALLAALAKSLK